MGKPQFLDPVRAYASFEVETVPPTAKLHEVALILRRRGVSAVAVAGSDAKVLGMVSSRDVLAAVDVELRPGAMPRVLPTERAVDEVMVRDLATIDEGDTMVAAATKLVERRIHRLWVTAGGVISGVLTVNDLMRAVAQHEVETPLAAIMTKAVQVIDLGAPVRDAVAQLAQASVHGLVVVDGAEAIGVFTRTEAIAARHLPPTLLDTPVERVMSYEVISLPSETPLRRAATQANALHLRRIFATEHGKLAGIVTGFDFARFVASPG
jgi:CBS domain-containing protein